MLSACSHISKTRHKSLLDDLYLGKTVGIGSETTNTLNGLVKLIRQEESKLLESTLKEDIPLNDDKARSESYLANLRKERAPVIRMVADGAYGLIKRKS